MSNGDPLAQQRRKMLLRSPVWMNTHTGVFWGCFPPRFVNYCLLNFFISLSLGFSPWDESRNSVEKWFFFFLGKIIAAFWSRVLISITQRMWRKKGIRNALISFYKHQVYKHNQADIIDILNTLLNTSQPQIFRYFSFKNPKFDIWFYWLS